MAHGLAVDAGSNVALVSSSDGLWLVDLRSRIVTRLREGTYFGSSFSPDARQAVVVRWSWGFLHDKPLLDIIDVEEFLRQ